MNQPRPVPIKLAALLLLWVLTLALPASAATVSVQAPPDNDGLNLDVSWTESTDPAGWGVLRAEAGSSEWTLLKLLPGDAREHSDKVTTDVWNHPPADEYQYKVVALRAPVLLDEIEESEQVATVLAAGVASEPGTGSPKGSFIRTGLKSKNYGPLVMLLIILAVGVMMQKFTADVRAGKEVFIRRIPGIDAIEEGIGRATEMGKPILYVPGIDELQDIQTIASMLILGQVAEKVAEYQSDIIVSCCIPIVREVADEVVKSGFYQAGYPDAYNPRNTRFISSEQFAFCAGTNGIIYREQPATNIYLGRFFAESLILAETGFVNKSIQIAGTAEATQLPFFIAACDYTLIGEELFAVSAYLSKDPRLVSSLKASDWVKLFVVVCLIVGTVLTSFGLPIINNLFAISGG
ncbi:MAG: hypothetical protein KDA24_21300 [Deltaproteobacteria bacterium]|nr:hypothetical protein [Deltaproteobacteria bacterium]